jgi:formamidopyrimidine-DNA glycosylase
VVRTLAPRLTGRTIVHATFSSRHIVRERAAVLAARLSGRRVLAVRRRAKFVLLELDGGTLAIHLGMTGKLRFDCPASKHGYAVFELNDGVLLFDDPRQFGKIEWEPPRIAALGPEPLEIGPDEFAARLKQRRGRLKPLLLNQAFLGGLGNIYVDEALHRAGIHPLARAASLSAPRAARLLGAIREILTAAIALGGSTISDYVDAAGRRGGFQLLHRVYGRAGEPCLNCGAAIRKILVSQRGTHFCPRCQKR